MEQTMPGYRKIDLETWPRREHYRYYREFLKCGYSITARLDVTEAVRVNSMDEMKMMTAPDGTPGIWDEVHLNFTVFHKDDGTFSDLWTAYDPDFQTFYREWERVTETYGDCHGIKGRPGQPPNFFCISCVPWLDYTGYSTHTMGEPALFPIITFGKYTEEVGRLTLPATVTIAHAASDGYHTSQLFRRLQEQLDAFGGMM